MDPTFDLPPIGDVIRIHNLRAHKSLGQNFLTDPRITDRIAAQAGDIRNAHVIEIGPGPGGLTRSLLRAGAHNVTAIEFDDRAVTALQDLVRAAGGRLNVRHHDALKMDWENVFDPTRPNVIVANLPYNIATPLLIEWLKTIRHTPGHIDRMVLMFQHEVALRLIALPNTSDYGRLSVITQWLCTPERVMTLPPGAFSPPPKVYSSVVRFMPRALPLDAPSFETMETLLARAFAHRRKMMRSYLGDWVDDITACGLAPTDRAEMGTVDQFVMLGQRLTGRV
jgi:16S rRNA (adenine1518-N6/adenine1519-N6)-dimethyltransferase